jgi:hypothetical protein
MRTRLATLIAAIGLAIVTLTPAAAAPLSGLSRSDVTTTNSGVAVDTVGYGHRYYGHRHYRHRYYSGHYYRPHYYRPYYHHRPVVSFYFGPRHYRHYRHW